MDALTGFVQHQQARGLSPTTCKAYARDLAGLVHFLADGDIVRAGPVELERFVAELRRAGLRASTLSRKVACLKDFYRFLQHTGIIEADPTLALTRPQSPPRRPETLSVVQVERLLDTPDPSTAIGLRDRTLIACLYATGLEASQLVASNYEDIDFSGGQWHLPASGRKLPLDGRLYRQLADYLRSRPLVSNPALFVAQGRRLGIRTVQNRVALHGHSAIGLQVTPQLLRASYIAHLLTAGADLNVVQVLLAHRSAVATRSYSPLATERLRRIYDQAHPRSRLSRSDP